METLQIHSISSQVSFVLILPTRNGNNLLYMDTWILSASSYPTYEEWKPEGAINQIAGVVQFLSYLRGMETQ